MTDLLNDRRFRWAVEGLLALLILVQAVRLVLMLAAAPERPEGLPTALASVDPAVLVRFDPFFRGEGAAPAAGADSGGWTLHGLRAGGGSFDTAIISGADGKQAVYRVGEALAPGLILDSVAADHVLLSRGGALTRLGFPDAPPPPAGAEAAPAAAPAGSGEGQPAVTISSARFVADTALRPRLQGGRINGFVVQPRGKAETLAAAGLRAGDVLTAINGLPMESAERAADLETDLSGNQTAEIQFERDGQRHTVTVRIDPRDRQ